MQRDPKISIVSETLDMTRDLLKVSFAVSVTATILIASIISSLLPYSWASDVAQRCGARYALGTFSTALLIIVGVWLLATVSTILAMRNLNNQLADNPNLVTSSHPAHLRNAFREAVCLYSQVAVILVIFGVFAYSIWYTFDPPMVFSSDGKCDVV
jgi:hypothetical protein